MNKELIGYSRYDEEEKKRFIIITGGKKCRFTHKEWIVIDDKDRSMNELTESRFEGRFYICDQCRKLGEVGLFWVKYFTPIRNNPHMNPSKITTMCNKCKCKYPQDNWFPHIIFQH